MTKRITLKDVAKKARVSTAVASRVLGNYGYASKEARTKVLKSAEKLGYKSNFLARALKTQKTFQIGLLVPDIKTFFWTLLVRGVEDVLGKNGYHVSLANSDEHTKREYLYLQEFMQRQVDGIILAPTGNNTAYLNEIVKSGIPLILVDRKLAKLKTTTILMDNRRSAEEAVSHMIKQGYKRIAIIKGPEQWQTITERFEGYKTALKRHAIRFDKKMVRVGGFNMEKAALVTAELLEQKTLPDAIFITNETLIPGVIHVVQEKGLSVPEDIGILAFDDPVWAHLLKPPLTTVRQDSYGMGKQAAELMLELLSGNAKGNPQNIILQPELIVRGSCGETLLSKAP